MKRKMKGIQILVSVVLLLAILCACGKSEEAQHADNLIAEIGSVTLESEKAILEAEQAVAFLSEKDQRKMENLEVLYAARSAYNELLITSVEEKIAAFGEPDIEKEMLVSEARQAYMDLPVELQPEVSNYNLIEEAEAAIFREKVEIIENAIEAIGEVTLSSKALIDSAREVYNEYPAEIQESVSNYQQLVAAEEMFVTLSVSHVQDAINAIGEVTLDSDQAIADARAAYEKSPNEIKEQVNNYEMLEEAESTFNELRADYFRKLVNAIGVVDMGDKELIDAAFAAYKDMNSRQTALVTEEYRTLAEAEEEYYDILEEKLMSRMTIEEDEMWGTQWISPDAMPDYIDVRSYLLPYIGKQGSTKTLWLRYAYTEDSWVFFEQVTIKVDDQYYYKTFSYFEITRDNDGGDVWEYIDVRASSSDIQMLWEIVESEKTIIRFEGDEYYYDFTVSDKDKAAIEDVLLLYELMSK